IQVGGCQSVAVRGQGDVVDLAEFGSLEAPYLSPRGGVPEPSSKIPIACGQELAVTRKGEAAGTAASPADGSQPGDCPLRQRVAEKIDRRGRSLSRQRQGCRQPEQVEGRPMSCMQAPAVGSGKEPVVKSPGQVDMQ